MTVSPNPAIIIAGTQSGSGKTTVTMGLMAALQEKGHVVQPFKCGPDFIDPSLHRMITGRYSRNLDPWMCGADFVRSTFVRHSRNAEISVIEGVMGMYDGHVSSSASLARILEVPVVLVLDVRSAAESAAAVLKGFETFMPETAPRAVILNRVASERHLELVTSAIQVHCSSEIIGYLPRDLEFSVPSRHLGLKMGEETPLDRKRLAALARTVIEHIDLERLVALAAESASKEDYLVRECSDFRVRIGVALDKAFCFYYQDNLELLQEAGAELVFFSPLVDRTLPDNIDGLYFGGGYPELVAEDLSKNKTMLDIIRSEAEKGLPIYSECGGFMYLTEGIFDTADRFWKMAGIFPVCARMGKKRAGLGYREVRMQDDSFFGPAGTIMRGHEFHYSIIDGMPAHIHRLYAVNNGSFEGYRYKNVLGGYIHLHFGFTPKAAAAFIKTCQG